MTSLPNGLLLGSVGVALAGVMLYDHYKTGNDAGRASAAAEEERASNEKMAALQREVNAQRERKLAEAAQETAAKKKKSKIGDGGDFGVSLISFMEDRMRDSLRALADAAASLASSEAALPLVRVPTLNTPIVPHFAVLFAALLYGDPNLFYLMWYEHVLVPKDARFGFLNARLSRDGAALIVDWLCALRCDFSSEFLGSALNVRSEACRLVHAFSIADRQPCIFSTDVYEVREIALRCGLSFQRWADFKGRDMHNGASIAIWPQSGVDHEFNLEIGERFFVTNFDTAQPFHFEVQVNENRARFYRTIPIFRRKPKVTRLLSSRLEIISDMISAWNADMILQRIANFAGSMQPVETLRAAAITRLTGATLEHASVVAGTDFEFNFADSITSELAVFRRIEKDIAVDLRRGLSRAALRAEGVTEALHALQVDATVRDIMQLILLAYMTTPLTDALAPPKSFIGETPSFGTARSAVFLSVTESFKARLLVAATKSESARAQALDKERIVPQSTIYAFAAAFACALIIAVAVSWVGSSFPVHFVWARISSGRAPPALDIFLRACFNVSFLYSFWANLLMRSTSFFDFEARIVRPLLQRFSSRTAVPVAGELRELQERVRRQLSAWNAELLLRKLRGLDHKCISFEDFYLLRDVLVNVVDGSGAVPASLTAVLDTL